MKKYFMTQARQVSTSHISNTQIANYRRLLCAEMEKMGANESDMSLVCDAMIQNSILNNRKPEDVAWAILQ